MSKTIATIDLEQLARVHGGSDDKSQPPSYNGEDVKNGVQGGAAGARVAGPIGGIIGFGMGFMSRNAEKGVEAARDWFKERERGKELDKKLAERK